jgi:4-hydroxybenzoate polyprenyltransferase
MNRIVFLIQVSRPILWPVLPLVYFLGHHAARASISLAAVVQLLLLTFPMNLIGCGLNDIYDYDSDRRSERRRKVWGAVVRDEDRSFVWWSCVAMAPLVMAGAVLTRDPYNMMATLALLTVAWAYSVPPLRLKERPPLDALANGLGFFLLPFVMGYSLAGNPLEMPPRYYLLALAVCGVHALATAADYAADRAAGHRTLAVAFGRRAAAAFACLTFTIALSLGGYQGISVRVFLLVGTVASLAAALAPSDRMIAAACVTIFVGFILAAACHVAPW